MFDLIHCYTKAVLWHSEKESARDALGEAVEAGAVLRGANLTDADLTSADLTDADLTSADLWGANLTDADLTSADLTDADLTSADLWGANLTDAKLRGAVLPSGETWEQYLAEVVPALCTAGGVPLEQVATPKHWNCHSWEGDNCPMAAAYGIASESDGPRLLQPRIREFVQLFDAGLIPMPVVPTKGTGRGGALKCD